MRCPGCLDYLNNSGHCYTASCDNRQPETSAKTKPKPKPRLAITKQSAKQRKLYQQTKSFRWGPIYAKQPCDKCQKRPATEPHEIAAGAHRQRALQDVRALSYLCSDCHRVMQGMPYPKQIAIVLKSIVASANRCSGRQAVSVEDVIRELTLSE